MKNAYEHAEAAGAYLRDQTQAPQVAVVLGSGLGAFAEQLHDPQVFSYTDLPHFPHVAVAGHRGQLVLGSIEAGGPKVAALAGRVHLYEGHDINVVVHPVRTMARWGVQTMVFTNAAGGINPNFVPGDLMLISDHLNLTGRNPLMGHNDERLGVRFPDMSDTYKASIREVFRQTASTAGLKLHEGVYAGLLGPSYETPAEIRMLQSMGGDSVGMSTVCEAIAAQHAGMSVAGVSCITNLAAGISANPLNHAEVKETAALARENFIALLTGAVRALSQN